MYSLSFRLVVVVLMTLLPFAAVQCQQIAGNQDIDIESLKAKYLPAEFSKTNFTLDDAKKLLVQKCQKAGVTDPHIYENLAKASAELMACGETVANLTVVLAEMEAARPLGDLDVVFEKYCDRQPLAQKCLHDFNAQLLPCLNAEELAQNAVLMRIVDALIGFICYKKGDQIALFIAEEGPECLEANKQNIANCMNSTFAAYLPKDEAGGPLTELPDLVMTTEQCIDLYDFEECVLGYLEQCNEITPANIIESLFRYVRDETKCQPEINKVIKEKAMQARNGGAARWWQGLTAVVMVVVVGVAVTGRYNM